MRGRHASELVVAVALGGLLTAGVAGTSTTGTSPDDPAGEDVCPEDHPELDPTDPVETLHGPEPDPGRDLCATWITAEWEGYGDRAELVAVTFGVRTHGEVDLGADRSFAFLWDVPTSYDTELPVLPGDDDACTTTVWLTDGSVHPAVSFRACGSATLDYLVGDAVDAEVRTAGDVVQVRIPVASAPSALAASLVNGGTLWSFGARSYLVEPWSEDWVAADDDPVLRPPVQDEGGA
ncbi:MAG: hypothetical protein KY461_11725 [Actinobacteria bacterium]|nr:hypothetical protein [Actinomycetota bacterium]